MKKKIFSLICSLALLITMLPTVSADTYTNSAFVGKYLSAGATASTYAELNVLTCNSETITVDFKFIKNDNQQLIYTCHEGKMNDTTGEVPFSVSYANGQFVANGVMTLTLSDWCIDISCDSDRQHLFDGKMKPQFILDPHNTGDVSDIPSISTDVSVILNGENVTFPEGISPIIINESTYVPLRSVFDKMGINVYWDQYKKNDILNAQSITCTKNNTIVQFMRTFNDTGSNVWTLNKWVDKNTDSNEFTRINITDLQPTIIGNSSYIPLRVVSEAFGADVGWIHEDRVVTIACDTQNSFKYDNELIGKIEDFSQANATECITDDYTSVIADTVPYFSPQAKFYKYSANDRWGKVELHIFYGGFVEVYPVTEDADAEPAAPVETEAPTETIPETDVVVENEPIEITEKTDVSTDIIETPADTSAPTEPEAEVTDEV